LKSNERNNPMRRIAILTAAVAVAAVAGCGHRLVLPKDFVELEQARPYEFRGVSADGTNLAVRVERNPKQGTQQFWSKAITNELTGRGYKLQKKQPVENTSGRKGELLSFSIERSGQEFTYLLALYVTEQEVLIAEAGGKSEAIRPRLEEIKRSLLSVK